MNGTVRENGQREHERQHAALVELTRSPVWHGSDEVAVLREITRTVAGAMDIARVSFWRYSGGREAIICQDLFEAATQRHSSGQELRERDFPAYFQAMASSEIIAADDARRDPRTREFTPTYLEPLGIAAMLDTPVQVAGKLAGVLCLEHIGTPRAWTPGERSFAVAAGSLLALALAQSALTRSELRLRTILESEPECVKVVSAAGVLLDMNAAGLRMIDADERTEVIGLPVLQLIHPEDQAAFDELHRRACRGETGQLQFRTRGLKGTERWVETNSAPFREADGRISSVLSVTRDITKRKLAEEALRESEQRFQAFMDDNPAAAWMKDESGRYVFGNAALLALYQRPRAAVLGRTDHELLPESVAQQLRANDLAVLAAGRPLETIENVPTADGEMHVWQVTKFPFADATGRRYVGGLAMDITERRLAETTVREQAELLDKAQDAILVRDLEHRIRYWNKSAERLYGWTSTEAVGRSVKELLYHDPAAFLKATAATLETGEWVGELTQFNKAGESLIVEGRWTLVRDGQGRPKSILAINTDISERKRIEQQLLRTQRMESLGTLAGGIAHDLNNVLAPILVSIEFLRLDERDSERLTVLASLEDSARRGADLVRQVLSFARGIEGERVLTNLQHLARELQQIVRDTFPKNIEFRLESAKDLWTVSADPTQMHQVLMNLCVNARDAMPEGGRLTLGLRNFEVDDIFAGMNPDARPGPYVIIKVEDTGTGIPANIQERIFEPFFTTKEFGKGTGLGLATVLTIVKSHGGFIHLYSEPGKGTKFKVYLPAGGTPESGERPAAEANRLPGGRGELILVVDDEEGVRTVTRRTLERFGYRVMLAVHGAEAVALYAEQGAEIAVVLTDMAMPVMDGPATILALKAMNPAVKIIGSSGHASGGSVAKATGAGVDHFVPKPYTAETLLKVLDEVLARPV